MNDEQHEGLGTQHFAQRPATAPDFLLSRPHRSIRTQGIKAIFPDPFEAATSLRQGDVSLIVGAIPFDTSDCAALMEPITTTFSDGPLEPPAVYRGIAAQESLIVDAVEPLTTLEEHHATVSAAIATIHTTALEKIVLARAVDVTLAQPADPLLIAARFIDLSANRDGFAVNLAATGREERAEEMFLGSSPEVLIRKTGNQVFAYPLAGSIRRTGDRVTDTAAAEHLRHSTKDQHEHAFVTDHYRAILAPLCSELSIPATPEIHETSEVIHLGTPIRGVLTDASVSALDLALMLHPTPAVGGTPTESAVRIIHDVEEWREFYAGAVGWCDSSGDGEFMVAIRSCIVADHTVRLWAGGGIVATSSAAEETAETQTKMATAYKALNVPHHMWV